MNYEIELFKDHTYGVYLCTIRVTTGIVIDDWRMDLYTLGAGLLTKIGSEGEGSGTVGSGIIYFNDGSLIVDPIFMSLDFGRSSDFALGDWGWGFLDECEPPQPYPYPVKGRISARF